MAEKPEKRTVHWGVQAFVLFHIFAITSWSLPKPPDRELVGLRDAPNKILLYNERHVKRSPMKYYLESTGLWQYWDMFSPNPANTDIWMDAVVTYEDGAKMQYRYPRMKDLQLRKKYVEMYTKERYRKFVENAHMDKNRYKWPAVAQRIAYLSYQDADNLPVMVELRRHFKVINAPGEEQADEHTAYSFYFYMVDQARLAKDVAQ